MPSQPFKTRRQALTPALGAHLYKAKLIVYGSLLIVGGVQIVIRERFPTVHPPWPLIGGSLMVVLLCVVLVPPVLLLIGARKNAGSDNNQPHSAAAASERREVIPREGRRSA